MTIVKATTSMGEAFLFKNSYLKKLSSLRSVCTISIGDIIDEEAIQEKSFHCSVADFTSNCHLLYVLLPSLVRGANTRVFLDLLSPKGFESTTFPN